MNTSTGAPFSICVCKVPEEAKFGVMVTFGFPWVYIVLISFKASVKLAAAATLIVIGEA